ncbi:malonyl CoA-acyl carrier protein transacylase [Paenibacillus pini JCM 16418]|uniref:Malonyl CoA-acyl carrier protein transacylase n=1 Tax=Paenibacillus pini JCM 16418 TaxID=1236976 RepID=W7YD20_9BACL|nr:malonyl CoA-acyl carrier protein transacylase [Paenibacillus pini JCM 16418]
MHTACQALRKGDCELAIAGGIRLNLLPLDHAEDKVGMESSDGKTRTFDVQSDGAAMGEGVVTVLLKPVAQALQDRDHIYAVIKGSAVNQDGRSIGITAPNMQAQADLYIQAWQDANIDPLTISYIEAHGTAQSLEIRLRLRG